MKKTIELLKFAIKYGAYFTAVLTILGFAVKTLEEVKNPNEPQTNE